MPLRTAPLLLVLALLLGCPPDEDTVLPPYPGPDATPAAAVPKAPPAPTGEPVRLCVLLADTGAAKDESAEIRRGMRLAQERVNAEAWRTRTLTLEEHDTRSSEPGAVAEYMKCVGGGVPVAIGPVHPAAKTAILPVAAAHETVLVIPEVDSAVVSVWGENTIAVAPPNTYMGRTAARNMALERGIDKAAVLYAPGVFGEGIRDEFVRTFAEDKREVVHTAELDPALADGWKDAARQAVLDKGAVGVFVVGPAEAALEIASTLDDNGMLKAQFWFIDWAMFPPVLDMAAAKGGIQRVHWVNRKMPSGDFAKSFQARYQTRPQYEAGAGYDAVMLVADAVEKAKALTGPEIAAAMGQLNALPSAFGTGAVVGSKGLRYVDVADYRILEPGQDPDSIDGGWMFVEPP